MQSSGSSQTASSDRLCNLPCLTIQHWLAHHYQDSAQQLSIDGDDNPSSRCKQPLSLARHADTEQMVRTCMPGSLSHGH